MTRSHQRATSQENEATKKNIRESTQILLVSFFLSFIFEGTVWTYRAFVISEISLAIVF